MGFVKNQRIKPQNWVKRGLVYDNCHCQLPVAISENENIRIFVSTRDYNNHSQIVNFQVSKDNPSQIIKPHGKPLLQLGDFDSHGIMPSCLVDNHFYYVGWSKIGPYAYSHSIGLAIWENKQLTKIKCVLQATDKHHFICNSPFVLRENDLYKMWFVSGQNRGWCHLGPLYSICYAESYNGIDWKQIPIKFPNSPLEIFSRPFVWHDRGQYHMYYSYMELKLPKQYHIGYANSLDGQHWVRNDELSPIHASKSGWDSEMVAFPYIIGNYLFYSGNGFGNGGVGYAEQI